MKRNYYIVLDTETCPLVKDGEVNPFNMWCYDIGYAVIDKKGRVYETRSYIVKDIFFQEEECMKSAYYAEKIPRYMADIASGKRKVASFYEIRRELKELCEKYEVKAIMAHNARFDKGALDNTQRWLTKSKYRYFYPYGVELWDTLKMAKSIMPNKPTYVRWCKNNGYMTKHKKPQVRLTAEILWRYISQDDDFIESHTGLEDVMIEKEIFAYLIRQHKKMNKALYA